MKDPYIDKCIAEIELLLGWGDGQAWSTNDFEDLSVRIQEETGEVISTTTLKRIWGRVAYESRPSRHSLDVLAKFLDYPSWRVYVQVKQHAEDRPSDHRLSERTLHSFGAWFPKAALPAFMVFLGAAAVIWLGLSGLNGTASERTAAVQFSSRIVTSTLPNTVVFNYDVQDVQADSFFIQQSWDRRRRTQIDPTLQTHASVYYLPGFFNAKLIANDVILKELPIHIKTASWIAVVETEPEPLYLPREALLDDGTLTVLYSWLLENGLDPEENGQYIGYYYVNDFSPLSINNMSLSTLVRVDQAEVRRPCHGGFLTLRGEEGIIRIPIDEPGCAAVMNVVAGEVYHPGETHDISVLGADYTSWKSVSVEVQDQHVTIQIGTNPPYTVTYTNDLGKLVGIWFKFKGQGAVDDVVLQDLSGRIIYEESF